MSNLTAVNRGAGMQPACSCCFVHTALTVPRSLPCRSPKGTYSNEVGASECEPCAAGQYSNSDGGRTCKVSQSARAP